MLKWIIEQLKGLLLLMIVTIPFGLINTITDNYR